MYACAPYAKRNHTEWREASGEQPKPCDVAEPQGIEKEKGANWKGSATARWPLPRLKV
jgi:hypothetical protein